jgi:RES domain
MVGSRPTAEIATVELETATVAAGQRFGRLYSSRYTDPLGFGKTPSRFSDPRRRIERNRFGVLYLGESLKVCFLEAVLRDQRNGAVGDFLLSEQELRARRFAEIAIARELTLVDFRGDAAIRMGVPSDVVRGSQQSLSRWWSVAFHEHPRSPMVSSIHRG